MYSLPEHYNAIKGGFPLKKEDIHEVAESSGVLQAPMDYLDVDLREDLKSIIRNACEIDSNNVAHAFEFLKMTLKER